MGQGPLFAPPSRPSDQPPRCSNGMGRVRVEAVSRRFPSRGSVALRERPARKSRSTWGVSLALQLNLSELGRLEYYCDSHAYSCDFSNVEVNSRKAIWKNVEPCEKPSHTLTFLHEDRPAPPSIGVASSVSSPRAGRAAWEFDSRFEATSSALESTNPLPRHRMLFPIVAIVAVAFVIFFFLVENLSIADIYDIVIVRMTRVWYAAVLDRLEPNSRLLDVGIGTATALVSGKNKSVIIDKQLKIIGIDYEAAYVKKASFVCQQAGLSQQVKVYCQSIYDDKLHGLFSTERERFDAAYFSGSITLMPDPAEALKCAARMLKPGGVIYVTQTFQNRPSPFMEWLKPRLHKLTTIDFGRVTYHTEVAQIVRKAGMVIAEDAPVPGSINNANQTARMLVVKQIFSGSVLNPYNSQDMRSV